MVEPAKGEYKNVFGGRKDVTVLGTNPKLSQLLRINPFSFPENIHVLEHMRHMDLYFVSLQRFIKTREECFNARD